MASAGRYSKDLVRGVCGSWMFRSYSHAAGMSSSSCILTRRPSSHRVVVVHCPTTVHRACALTTSHNGSPPTPPHEEVLVVQTVHGLHQLLLPMVSRRERCRFTLQPFEKTLGDLFDNIRLEDRAIDNIQAQSTDGEILSVTTSIDSVLQRSFYLIINDTRYLVQVDQPSAERAVTSDNSMRQLVANLYRTVNLDQYHAVQHRQLLAQQSELLMKLAPLEKAKKEVEKKAVQRTRWLSWLGLGLMGTQFGFMARLTWWEYSWDIMEPVTYFVGYATTIAMFAYFVITRQEYVYPDVKDREQLVTLHGRAKRFNFDIAQYNDLRAQLAHVERDIKRLRDPLEVQLMLPHLPRNTSDC